MPGPYGNSLNQPVIWLYSRYPNPARQLALVHDLTGYMPNLYWLETGRVAERLLGFHHAFVMHWHCEPMELADKEYLQSHKAVIIPVHCTRELCPECRERHAEKSPN